MNDQGTWRCEQLGVQQLEVEQPVPRLLGRDGARTESSLGTGSSTPRSSTPRSSTVALLALATLLVGCDSGPKPIRYGRDECAECKMTLVDQHYGAEFISARGRVYTFDDLNCLTAYQRRPSTQAGSGARAVVVDFQRANQFIPVDQALFLQHPGLRTPMASGLAAFVNEADLEAARRELGGGGRVLRWPEVQALPP
jgi:copper chaperone NosL